MPASDDESMKRPRGDLIFSVQGVHFCVSHNAVLLEPHASLIRILIPKIPAALLALHSETFASMIELGAPCTEAIELDDSLSAFRDWMSLLMK